MNSSDLNSKTVSTDVADDHDSDVELQGIIDMNFNSERQEQVNPKNVSSVPNLECLQGTDDVILIDNDDNDDDDLYVEWESFSCTNDLGVRSELVHNPKGEKDENENATLAIHCSETSSPQNSPEKVESALDATLDHDYIACNTVKTKETEGLSKPVNQTAKKSSSQSSSQEVDSVSATHDLAACSTTRKKFTLPYYQLPKPDLDQFMEETEKNLNTVPMESVTGISDPTRKLKEDIVFDIEDNCQVSIGKTKPLQNAVSNSSENVGLTNSGGKTNEEVSKKKISKEYVSTISSINNLDSKTPGIKKVVLQKYLKKKIDEKKVSAFNKSKDASKIDEEINSEEEYKSGEEESSDDESIDEEFEERTVSLSKPNDVCPALDASATEENKIVPRPENNSLNAQFDSKSNRNIKISRRKNIPIKIPYSSKDKLNSAEEDSDVDSAEEIFVQKVSHPSSGKPRNVFIPYDHYSESVESADEIFEHQKVPSLSSKPENFFIPYAHNSMTKQLQFSHEEVGEDNDLRNKRVVRPLPSTDDESDSSEETNDDARGHQNSFSAPTCQWIGGGIIFINNKMYGMDVCHGTDEFQGRRSSIHSNQPGRTVLNQENNLNLPFSSNGFLFPHVQQSINRHESGPVPLYQTHKRGTFFNQSNNVNFHSSVNGSSYSQLQVVSDYCKSFQLAPFRQSISTYQPGSIVPCKPGCFPNQEHQHFSSYTPCQLNNQRHNSFSYSQGFSNPQTIHPQFHGDTQGMHPEFPGNQQGIQPQFPDAPQGMHTQFPSNPQGMHPQFPSSPQRMYSQFPGSPQGMHPQFPRSPQGMHPQFPGSPQRMNPQFPGSPQEMHPQFPGSPQRMHPQFPGSPQRMNPQFPCDQQRIHLQLPADQQEMHPQFPGDQQGIRHQIPSTLQETHLEFPSIMTDLRNLDGLGLHLKNLPVSQSQTAPDMFSSQELASVCSGVFKSNTVPESRYQREHIWSQNRPRHEGDIKKSFSRVPTHIDDSSTTNPNVMDFFEHEAELSGDDDGEDEDIESAEENENDIIIEPDHNLQAPEELRHEIIDLHQKQVRDDDDKALKQLQEKYIDGGELYGEKRARSFAWAKNDWAMENAKESSSESDSEAAHDDNWDKEKAKWRQENKEDDFADELNSSNRKRSLKYNIIGKTNFANKNQSTSQHLIPVKRGSFLHLDDPSVIHVLKKMKTSEDKDGGSRTTRHFVFRNGPDGFSTTTNIPLNLTIPGPSTERNVPLNLTTHGPSRENNVCHNLSSTGPFSVRNVLSNLCVPGPSTGTSVNHDLAGPSSSNTHSNFSVPGSSTGTNVNHNLTIARPPSVSIIHTSFPVPTSVSNMHQVCAHSGLSVDHNVSIRNPSETPEGSSTSSHSITHDSIFNKLP